MFSPTERRILLSGQIDDRVANDVIAQMLFLQMRDAREPILLVIDSPGGSVTATLAILDTMDFIKCPVFTRCETSAAGCALLLLCRGAKGRRTVTARASAGLVPVMGGLAPGAGSSNIDPEKTALFMIKLKNRLIGDFCRGTGQPMDVIEAGMEDSRTFSAAEAVQFGLADEVIYLDDGQAGCSPNS